MKIVMANFEYELRPSSAAIGALTSWRTISVDRTASNHRRLHVRRDLRLRVQRMVRVSSSSTPGVSDSSVLRQHLRLDVYRITCVIDRASKRSSKYGSPQDTPKFKPESSAGMKHAVT